MLKSQADERVAVLSDESQEVINKTVCWIYVQPSSKTISSERNIFVFQMDLEEELEKVQLEMMEQRARDLRHQEDKLGSMIAQLQLSKAREVGLIIETACISP